MEESSASPVFKESGRAVRCSQYCQEECFFSTRNTARHTSGDSPDFGRDAIRFKWHRQSELLPSLLNNTYEASAQFHREYLGALMVQVKTHFPHLISQELEKNPERLKPGVGCSEIG
jgi:hypothetical protein